MGGGGAGVEGDEAPEGDVVDDFLLQGKDPLSGEGEPEDGGGEGADGGDGVEVVDGGAVGADGVVAGAGGGEFHDAVAHGGM